MFLSHGWAVDFSQTTPLSLYSLCFKLFFSTFFLNPKDWNNSPFWLMSYYMWINKITVIVWLKRSMSSILSVHKDWWFARHTQPSLRRWEKIQLWSYMMHPPPKSPTCYSRGRQGSTFVSTNNSRSEPQTGEITLKQNPWWCETVEYEAAQWIMTGGAFKNQTALFFRPSRESQVVLLRTKARCGVVEHPGSRLSNYMEMLQK